MTAGEGFEGYECCDMEGRVRRGGRATGASGKLAVKKSSGGDSKCTPREAAGLTMRVACRHQEEA